MTMQLHAHNPIAVRQHILIPQSWGVAAGTDFWLQPSSSGMLTSGNAHELSDYGWTTTSLALVGGSAGDFLVIGDATYDPSHISTNAAGDLIQSPALFGDFYHGQQAASFLGVSPTTLIVEVLARFNAISADEPRTGFGFIEDGGAVGTQADHCAFIYSDNTNFVLHGGDGAESDGETDSTTWHVFRISLNGSTATWAIDGTEQGSITFIQDEFPVSFGMHTLTTNRIMLSTVHIWYE